MSGQWWSRPSRHASPGRHIPRKRSAAPRRSSAASRCRAWSTSRYGTTSASRCRDLSSSSSGFEPPDPRVRHSADLHACACDFASAPPGIRTQNLRIKSQSQFVRRVMRSRHMCWSGQVFDGASFAVYRLVTADAGSLGGQSGGRVAPRSVVRRVGNRSSPLLPTNARALAAALSFNGTYLESWLGCPRCSRRGG